MDEITRQEMLKMFDMSADNDVYSLYLKGWKVVDIADSKDTPVSIIVEILADHGTTVPPDQREEVQARIKLEEELDYYKIRRIK